MLPSASVHRFTRSPAEALFPHQAAWLMIQIPHQAAMVSDAGPGAALAFSEKVLLTFLAGPPRPGAPLACGVPRVRCRGSSGEWDLWAACYGRPRSGGSWWALGACSRPQDTQKTAWLLASPAYFLCFSTRAGRDVRPTKSCSALPQATMTQGFSRLHQHGKALNPDSLKVPQWAGAWFEALSPREQASEERPQT